MPQAKPQRDGLNPAAKHANRYWGATALPKTKAEFFDAVTAPAPTGDGTIATIRMYGPVDSWGGFWGISAKDVGSVLDALPEEVTQIILRINSPGGEVFEGMAILNMFRAHKASVTAVVDGLAASTASFIAAGCDETVMSPGTQMLIHSPSTITWGNAADLRKDADALDKCAASIVEIYSAKAGQKDWPTLMADDNWLTATDTVELGLANRVAVIPDAGETATAGIDEGVDELIVLPDEDDPTDRAARLVRIAHAFTQRPKLPSSAEPGETRRTENAVAYSDLTAGLRNRLGVTDAEANDETLLAALDEALAEQPTNTTVPDGTTLIDNSVLGDLQAAAAEVRQIRAEQATARREQILNTAVQEGRIAPASRASWLASLEASEDTTTALLNSMAKNTIPVTEQGRSDEPSTADDLLYNDLFGDEKKGA